MINVLGNRYAVRPDSTLLVEENKLGATDMAAGEIRWYPNVLPEMVPHVIFHELVHALLFLGHLQFLVHPVTKQHDEAGIDAIVSLLLDVLRTNGLLNEERLRELINDG